MLFLLKRFRNSIDDRRSVQMPPMHPEKKVMNYFIPSTEPNTAFNESSAHRYAYTAFAVFPWR